MLGFADDGRQLRQHQVFLGRFAENLGGVIADQRGGRPLQRQGAGQQFLAEAALAHGFDIGSGLGSVHIGVQAFIDALDRTLGHGGQDAGGGVGRRAVPVTVKFA